MADKKSKKSEEKDTRMPLKSQVRYMGFGWRMMAQMLDILLVCVILFPGVPMFNSLYYSPEQLDVMASPVLQQSLSIHEAFLLALPSIMFQYIILSLYIIGFWIWWGATPGKRLLSMRIVDARTGDKPTVKQFLLRFLGYILSVLPIGLGFVAIYYSRKKQGWHDMMSGTTVVEYRKRQMQTMSSEAAKS